MIEPLRGQADSALDSLLDRSQLRSVLETEAPELLIEFYTLYLEQLCGMAEQIRSASFTNDFGAVARQAHKMKSSSRSVGAFRVAQRLCEAEEAALECNGEQLQNIIGILAQDCEKTIQELKREILVLRAMGIDGQ